MYHKFWRIEHLTMSQIHESKQQCEHTVYCTGELSAELTVSGDRDRCGGNAATLSGGEALPPY